MTNSVLVQEKKAIKVPGFAWVILGAVMLVGLAAPLARIKVAALMPTLIKFFELNKTQSGFLMGLYSFTGIFLAIPAALIIARIGLKNAGLISAGCVVLGSALGAIANSFGILQVGRVLEGLSMPLIAVAGPAAVAMWFHKDRRGVPMAIWSLWVPLGSTIGMNVVPQILKTSTWQTVYWVNAIFGLVAFVFWLVFYRNPNKAEVGVDRFPTKEEEIAEKSNVLKTFGDALKIKDVWYIAGCMVCFSLAMGVVQGFGMTHLREALGLPPPQAAFITSLQFIACLVAAWLVGMLSDRLGSRKKFLFVGYIIFLISLFFWPSQNVSLQYGFFILAGLAAAIITPMVFTSMPEALSDKRKFIAAGMAMIATGQGLGNFFGPWVAGKMIDTGGWGWAVYWLIPVFLIGMFLTSKLKVR